MIILAIVLLLIVGVVAFLNMETVMLNLYLTSFDLPLWLVIVGTLLLGIVIAGLLASAVIERHKQALRDKDEEMDRAEAERRESVEKVRQDADAQIEIQKKEAEIQRLNAQLASNQNRNQSVNETSVEGPESRHTRVDVPEENHTIIDVHEENNHDRTKLNPR
ncbi:hypothetical protein GCM10008932_18200 [Alkalibacterium iburiense]|uniref:Lipopolysaccharide assembly protein A domain-containing protein n=1 Tax=Alkalibacterium iburiense TaxID=290589 RepID=A0ABN0XKH9_9LACT